MTVDEIQFAFMSERKLIDAVFILRRMQEEYHAKEKRCMCLMGLEKAFGRVPRKVLEWARRMKGISEGYISFG